jgi:molecular chaperone DnaJ
LIRNYFADLELSPEAGLEEIKKAYRRLVRRFHPDLNPKDAYAEESFKRIQEAYEHLNSEVQIRNVRKNLFENSKLPISAKSWRRQSFFAGDAEDIVEGKSFRTESRSPENLDIFLESHCRPTDRTHAISYSAEEICPDCRGVGGNSQSIQQTCKLCAGLSYQLIRRGAFRWKKTCDSCRGRGYEVLSACKKCDGYGKISSIKEVHLPIPKSLDQPQTVAYPHLGHEAFDSKRRGTLWVSWRIKK